MQPTRQHILEILKESGEATVDEIVTALSERIGDITAVTVRHHLEILRGDGLVSAPAVRRRTTPGRPQHVYSLTDKALELFPNNYRNLAEELLFQLKSHLPKRESQCHSGRRGRPDGGRACLPTTPPCPCGWIRWSNT
jgi:predicted ArsR family transcriptional regulator